MKMNNVDKVQTAIQPGPVHQKEKSGDDKFASVLEQKVAATNQTVQKPMPSLAPLMPPIAEMKIGPTMQEQTANGLIKSLEAYQQSLADQTVTLKDLAPALELMREQSDNAKNTLDTIAEGDPLKSIIEETILVISTEIERFNLGAYVDA